MPINHLELVALANRVTTDRLFCGDEHHRALAVGVLSLIEENKRLEAPSRQTNDHIAASPANSPDGLAEECRALRAENEQLKATNEAWDAAWGAHVEARERWANEVVDAGDLRNEAALHAQIERATAELPLGWNIRITVVPHAAGVELRNACGKVDLKGQGSVRDQVSKAIDLARSMAGEVLS
ncbi:hypothetical protein IYR97_24265 (plasmid) [Pseudomonas fulva]|uniref:Ead/Ea22-like family protein n=2 Tax=Pseudomonas putida group TaxID=136845 RepID=A0ABD7BPH6_PSEPU|nr:MULTISPECIES: hypothetical protein [Pseudomonas putida group]QOD01637.1 hypothetical protein ID616_30930 [Pseudomonas putida]QPH46909.1 hypothetical protein IYR97_24265 [Pseudomonas fulva]QPH52084.1 hypothetical protein IZU98_24720 [Pseudomonas fulva]